MNYSISKNIRRSFFIVSVCLLLCCIAHAQSPDATVSGIITEKVSGETVIGISVLLYRDSIPTVPTKPARGAATNKFGFYSIPKVAPGLYYLMIRGVGYKTYTQRVNIADTVATIKLNIQLETEDVHSQEVTIEGDKENNPTHTISMISIDPNFINQMPVLGGERDVFRVLQLLPGIKAASEISSGLYIRGGSPDQNLTLLDGVIVYNPAHLGGFLSTFNSDALHDVRVIKGAFPAEYGGRLSSVIDMTMREGTKEKIKGSGGISLISSRLTVEGPINENATFMVSGRRMYLDLILPLFDTKGEAPRYYFYDLNAKMNLKLSESDHIYGSGYFGRDVLYSPSSANFRDDNFDISWGNSTANLRWMHIMSPSVFTNFSFIYTNYQFSTGITQDSSRFEAISRIRDYVLRGEAQYFPGENHIIKGGAEVTWHNFRVGVDQSNGGRSPFEDFQIHTNDLTSLEAAVYAQHEWNITSRLSTNIGGRLYYFQNGGYVEFEPRVSASYEIMDDIRLKGSFAVANQFLQLIVYNDIALPTDLWFPSTSTIKPGHSIQGVLGLETTLFDKEYLLTVEGYYKDMKNLYEYKDGAELTFGAPLDSQFTVGRGDAYGVEFFLNKRVGNITGWVGYTLAWTKRYFDELNNGKPFYPRYDRRHDISVVFAYKLGESWELGATWVYGTGQAYTVPSGQYAFQTVEGPPSSGPYYDYFDSKDNYTERNAYRLPAFHKLDLNFMYKFSWFNLPFQFSINIYNAYNHKNTFSQYISREYTGDSNSRVLKRITLFPFLPTFGLSFTF